MRKLVAAMTGLVLANGIAFAKTNHTPTVSERAPRPIDAVTGEKMVVIVPEWRELYPFSERFAMERQSLVDSHVIDLAAVRFRTDSLRLTGDKAVRAFAEPELDSFSPDLVRDSEADIGSDLFIVQAASPDEQTRLREWLAADGVRILAYVPHNAYLVRLDRSRVSKARQRSEVFWMGLFQPAYRIEPKLDYVIEASPEHQMKMRVNFDATLFATADAVRSALEAVKLEVLDITRRDTDWTVRLRGPVVEARRVAVLPGCLWVERFVDHELHNNMARTSS